MFELIIFFSYVLPFLAGLIFFYLLLRIARALESINRTLRQRNRDHF